MSLAPQQVTNEQLVPGKYIRAIVNPHGKVMFDVLNVVGEVYERDWWRGAKLPAVRVSYEGSTHVREYYLSDLGVAGICKDRLTKLFPYSQELLDELLRHYNNGRQFNREYTEFIIGSELSEAEWYDMVGEQELDQQMSDRY